MVLAILVAAVLGLGGCVIYRASFFLLFISPVYGGFVGDMVMRAAGRKQSSTITGVTAACIVLGGVLGALPEIGSLIHGQGIPQSVLLTSVTTQLVWTGIGVVLAVSACIARMRYL